MKTKTNRSQKGAAARPSESITLTLDERTAPLLRACAAYDGQSAEEFAHTALRGALACVAEAIGHELKQAG